MKEYESSTNKPAEEVVFDSLAVGMRAMDAILPSRAVAKEIFVREVVGPAWRRLSRGLQRRRYR